jgi:3-oxoacid CoA-transferase subunit A
MTINKIVSSPAEALKDVADGCSIIFGGFGTTGVPFNLIRALRDRGTKQITAISNSSGGRLEDIDVSILFKNRQVKKVITSFTAYSGTVSAFEKQYINGEVELELVPQGTLAERIRAGGAGIVGFYTDVGMGTLIERGKE